MKYINHSDSLISLLGHTPYNLVSLRFSDLAPFLLFCFCFTFSSWVTVNVTNPSDNYNKVGRGQFTNYLPWHRSILFWHGWIIICVRFMRQDSYLKCGSTHLPKRQFSYTTVAWWKTLCRAGMILYFSYLNLKKTF